MNINPLQTIGPDPNIVEIEDDSADKSSKMPKESEDANEEVAGEEEAEDEPADDEEVEEQMVATSSSRTPVERGIESSSQPPRREEESLL